MFYRIKFFKNIECFFRIKNYIFVISNIIFNNSVVFSFKIRSKLRTRSSISDTVCNSYSFCTSNIIMRFKLTRSFSNHYTFKNSVSNVLRIISIRCIFVRVKNNILYFHFFYAFFGIYKKSYNISCFFAGKRYVKFSTPSRTIFVKEKHAFGLVKIRLSPIATFRNIIRVKFAKSLNICSKQTNIHVFYKIFRERIITGCVFFKKRHNNYLDKFININSVVGAESTIRITIDKTFFYTFGNFIFGPMTSNVFELNSCSLSLICRRKIKDRNSYKSKSYKNTKRTIFCKRFNHLRSLQILIIIWLIILITSRITN